MIIYVMHKKSGAVGRADVPEWLNFDETPPRKFDVWWDNSPRLTEVSTRAVVPITKEVADLMRGL